MNSSRIKEFIKKEAHQLGFSFIGFAKAEALDEEAIRLRQWLDRGLHGQMGYMANHFDLRTDPRKLVPGAKTVVSLLFNYHSQKKQSDPAAPVLSQYAFGEDYHRVLKRKLKQLLKTVRAEVGEVNGRCFVDSAPVMERQWAQRSGLGWLGKNTLLIHPKAGSCFFIAELIIDLDLEPDAPIGDHCGTCTRCIEACPTDAIAPEGYLLDASRCISYLTIELREEIPAAFHGKMENRVFGCDICQEVCPWNRFASPHEEADFEPSEELLQMTRRDWHEMTEEVFEKLFSKSAVKRTKFNGLRRNLDFLENGDSH